MWKEIAIKNWQHFNDIISMFNGRGWIFRGQRSSDWQLETSFYRECNNMLKKAENEKLLTIENIMYKEFRSSYKLYSYQHITEYPNSDSEKEWLEEKLGLLHLCNITAHQQG